MQLANMMVVPPSLPVKTVAEFIAYAKANPGKVTFASSGNGTSVHMSGELFKMMTNLDIVHVPYRGSAGIYPDLMTGKVHSLFDNLPGSVEFVKTGKLRALGVTTAKRNAALPDVPTVGETVQGYEASVFYGVAGPKGMPPDVVEILNKAFNAALADPKIQKRIAELGGEPTPMTPAQFGKLVADETEKWGKVVKAANFRWSRGSTLACFSLPLAGEKKTHASWRGAKTIRPRGGCSRAADLGPSVNLRTLISSCAWRRSRWSAATPGRGSPC